MSSSARSSEPALAGRRLLLGVSGGVAAYKAVYLARRLIEAGAEVQAVMTAGSLHFVGAQSLAAVTGRPPVLSLYGGPSVSPHTEMAAWADALVVAPATANLMAKMSVGIADDALSAAAAAFDGPVVMAPAMHTEMWEQPAVQRSARRLSEDGRLLVGPVSGALAGGGAGVGRMAEPEEISRALAGVFDSSLAGLAVLVTAGGTREAIDPVRYVGNRSSGKMGFELAAEAARRGAQVVLVTAAPPPPLLPAGVEAVEVESAEDMAGEVWRRAEAVDAAVLAAAVADFRPAAPAGAKLARADGPPQIVLEPTPNVLAGLVERVRPGTTVVGFAAETGGLERAVGKAASYGVDFIAANDVTLPGSGFGGDTNQVSIIFPDGRRRDLGLMTKREAAGAVLSEVAALRAGVA